MTTRISGKIKLDYPSAVQMFLDYSASKNLSKATLDYYRFSLLPFTRFLDANYPDIILTAITPAIIREAVCWQMNRSSPATANHELVLIKRLFKFLRAEGYMEVNPAERLDKLKTPKHVIQTFSQEQIAKLLNTCSNRYFPDIRDKLIFLILIDTGMRASELCSLAIEDTDLVGQTFRIRHGKGDKERIVPFGEGVKCALRRYMKAREGVTSPQLIITRDCNQFERNWLLHMMYRRCKQAGISGVRPSPHTLRHTCAVNYLRAGGDTFSLQRLLGHTSQEMTKRYCESLSDEDVQSKHRVYSPVDNMNLGAETTKRKRLR